MEIYNYYLELTFFNCCTIKKKNISIYMNVEMKIAENKT